MRRRLRRFAPLIAFVLIHLMTPGSTELAENIIHFVASGHLAHAKQCGDSQPADQEHACSGPYHFCACHYSTGFLVAPAREVDAALLTNQQLVWFADEPPGDPVPGGIDRPPRA